MFKKLCQLINFVKMTGSTTKYFYRPIIVDEGQLRYLSEIVKERFGVVEYGIETIDGDQYDYSSLDELLAYKNPNSRKITNISIRGNHYNGGSSSVPELYLTIGDRSKSKLSCYMQLRCLEEFDITFFKSRMDCFVKDDSVDYWWMYKPACYWTFGACLYLLFAAVLPWYIGRVYHVDVSYNIVVKLCWSLSSMAITILLIKKGLLWLFPAGGFRIGDQIKVLNRKVKVRKWILGIITTVIAGVIVRCLTK